MVAANGPTTASRYSTLQEAALSTRYGILGLVFAIALGLFTSSAQVALAAPVSGAIFTTNVSCNGTNINIYSDKNDVYLDGGPTHPGAAGLPDGNYYVKVTQPNGTLLGSTATASVSVVNGEFATCYNLMTIAPFADTSNSGGEYKVWISKDSTFPEADSKTDNFKVKADTCTDCGVGAPPVLHVRKFYDANANGVYDAGEAKVTGWRVRIQDGMDIIRYTPVDQILDADTYTITESTPIQTNWIATGVCVAVGNVDPCTSTTPTTTTQTLADDTETTVLFGNVCLGAGGGLTLGFWSNKNGQALFGSDDLALMVSLNLRNANGSDFNPADYAAFRTWILSASATNMAYMLSAQLAAMELNVLNGKVSGTSLVYAPGATSANSLGFATISDLMAEANTSLGANGNTVASGATRAYQEALKNALDKANNNLNFVQATPCAFSFAQ